MSTWLIIISIIYVSLLILLSLRLRRKTKTTQDFIFAGSNVGMILGFLTFAATLFSTFTLMGMPDFFRLNGVGAWIFLAVSDGAMVFLIVWFGFHLRQKVAQKGFNGISGLLNVCYGNRWAGYVYFFGAFIFLIPYVAIQIRGVAIFLDATFPDILPVWVWASIIIVTLLVYSELGGLKAIMYADSMQGIILLTVVWIIALNCIRFFGSIPEMFRQVEELNRELLSVPGPTGLFNFQFLLASLLAILLLPVTQPQLTTRLVVMKNLRATHRMAVGVGVFANLIIFPTLILGFYGAVRYPDKSTADFISQVLLFDQPGIIAALAIIGLLAAALSTSDSQIFALGTELRSLMKGDERIVLSRTRIAMVIFGLAALVFSILSSDELVLLARISFAGTSLMAPMIFIAIFLQHPPGKAIPFITFAGLIVFVLSQLEWIPGTVMNIRMDLFLLILLSILSAIFALIAGRSPVLKNNGYL